MAAVLFLTCVVGFGWYVGVAVYMAFATAILYSAIRYRRTGWTWGAILGLLLLALPLWHRGLMLFVYWSAGLKK